MRRTTAAGEFGQDLSGIAECEIVQQHDHFLRICTPIFFGVHDERRRHQKLLLQPVMGVHPMCAAARGEIVGLAIACAY